MPSAELLASPNATKVFHRSLKLAHTPLFIAKASGSYLYTEDGRKILDGCGGAAVVSIGHGDARIIKAVAEQMGSVAYLHSGAFANRVRAASSLEGEAREEIEVAEPPLLSVLQAAEELADLLTEAGTVFERALFNCGGSVRRFCSSFPHWRLSLLFYTRSGSRRISHQARTAIPHREQAARARAPPFSPRQVFNSPRSTHQLNFIARDQSYHGNSLGALSLCRHVSRRAPYTPLLSSETFHAVSPCYAYRYKLPSESDTDYVVRLKQELEDKFVELGPGTVAAFFAETVVGATSGCTTAVPGYFVAMREVCDKYGALFVLDEVRGKFLG